MKSILLKLSLTVFSFFFITSSTSLKVEKTFQGKAYYFSKSRMDLGRWGARLSEAQKKQVAARLKNRLEKNYVLTFNKQESFFKEVDKLDAISGATDSWGANFTPGDQYKNVKDNQQIQNQEFYGKKFLVKDSLLNLEWQMSSESKKIGNYMCLKAKALVPKNDLTWYSFSWDKLRTKEKNETDSTQVKQIELVEIEAWYTPQIPVMHGPLEYWGLPGLILEVSAGDTTMLCSKIVMNPEEKEEIIAPDKGVEITKKEYQKLIMNKMKEFRDNRMRRRG